MEKDGEPAGLRLVHDTVRVLEYLAQTGEPVGVRQLAAALEISKSTCHRILASLRQEEVVIQASRSSEYQLGPRIIRFAAAYRGSSRLLTMANPVLARLADETGETSCLYIPVRDGRMAVLQTESVHPLRWVAEVGRIYPLYLGAAGKVLLACMSASRIERELRRCAEVKGEDFSAKIAQQLPSILASGVTSSIGENIPSVAGAAAVIRSAAGEPAASISIYGPTSRVDADTMARFELLLADAATRLAEQAAVVTPLR